MRPTKFVLATLIVLIGGGIIIGLTSPYSAGQTVNPPQPGSSGGCSSGTTTNLLVGNGSGGCSSSGIAASDAARLSANNVYTATNGASASAAQFTGALTTGLTGTTAFPFLYVNQGAGPTTFSTAGTLFGLNAPSAFAGNFLDFHTNGAAAIFSVASTGNLLTGGSLSLGGSSPISYVNRAKMFSTADGVLLFQNNAGTAFSRVQFGSTTSSFPALNVNGAVLEAKLADNSTYTGFTARYVQAVAGLVSGLPTCNSGTEGSFSGVIDATLTITLGIGTVVAGTGSNHDAVYCDGANWRII